MSRGACTAGDRGAGTDLRRNEASTLGVVMPEIAPSRSATPSTATPVIVSGRARLRADGGRGWTWRVAVPAGLGVVAGFLLALVSGAAHVEGDKHVVVLIVGAAILVTGISVFSSWAVGRWADLERRRRRGKVARLHVARLLNILLGLETLIAQPRFADDPLLPDSPTFDALRSTIRRIGDAAELDPDFADLIDSVEDLDVLERARWAFQSSRTEFHAPDSATLDSGTLSDWLGVTLRTDRTRTALTLMIDHLETAERHLAVRAAG